VAVKLKIIKNVVDSVSFGCILKEKADVVNTITQ
jgi:hypothetical protein